MMSQFTEPQQRFLDDHRRIAPVAADRTESLYWFRRFRADADQLSVRATLVHGEFSFGRPQFFNDPFDCRPHYRLPDLSPSKLKEWFVEEGVAGAKLKMPLDELNEQSLRAEFEAKSVPDFFEKKEREVREWLCTRQRVLCLAGNRRSIRMWSHYADSHRGVAIHVRHDAWPIAAAHQVEYHDSYPSVEPSARPHGPYGEPTRVFTLRKSTEWAHEDEYRLIVLDEDPALMGVRWSADLALLGPDVICGVTAGALMSDADFVRLMTYAREFRPEIPVWRATPDRSSFSLRFKQSEA